MTGAWRLTTFGKTGASRFKKLISTSKQCHPETCPSAGEGPSLKHKKFSFYKYFPLYIREDRCIAFNYVQEDRCMVFKKQCHPETCPSAGEGPSEGESPSAGEGNR
jgi:hypothetical protein